MISAIILASGTGLRFQDNQPKQFMKLAGLPVIVHTIKTFQSSQLIDSVVVVCHEDYIDHVWELTAQYGLSKVEKVEEHRYLGENLRKAIVTKAKRELRPKDVAGETCFITCELMKHDSSGWTYFLAGSPNQLDPILKKLEHQELLLDQVYSITAL